MSDVTCNFCAHGNPEGSKFCNACGSPLNLTLCSGCEAVNSVSAKECYRCGARLSSVETEEIAIPPAALAEIAPSESPPAKDDSVPRALGERLDQLLGEPLARSHEPQETTAEDRPSLAASLTTDPASGDNRSLSQSHVGGATYPGRNRNRARAILLVVVLVTGAGAVLWTSVNPTHPPDLRSMTNEGSATAPEPASSAPAVPPEPADKPMESPTGLPRPGSSDADAAPQVQAPESETSRAPPRAEAADSPDHAASKTSDARAIDDARHIVTQGRTKKQAERDAMATSSLIARELGSSPPAGSENKPPGP
jgi:hypothetical protein